jgi:hypothetical protein
MKIFGGVEVQLHSFFTSATHGGEWSASRAGLFTPEKIARGAHWMGAGSREGYLVPAGNRAPAAQPVARGNTDRAMQVADQLFMERLLY